MTSLDTPRARAAGLISAVIAAVLIISSCGTTSPADDGSSSTGDSLVPAAEGKTEYPITLESPYGQTELKERPERIAVVSFDLAATLSLGVTPVLAYGEPESKYPWFEGTTVDQVETWIDPFVEGVPFEAILAAEPDLIIAVNYFPTASASLNLADDFDRLAAIAPVLAADEPSVEWQETLRTIGTALDLEDHAEDVISDVNEHVASVAAANPEFADKTVSFLVNRGEDSGIQFQNTSGSTTEDLLNSLGFAPHPHASELKSIENGILSLENLSLVDADVLVVGQHGGRNDPAIAQEWLNNSPLFQHLDVVQRGDVVSVEKDAESGGIELSAASLFPSALSIPWTVDEIERRFKELPIFSG